MGRLFDQIQEVFGRIFHWDMPGLMQVLAKPEITTAAFIALAIIGYTIGAKAGPRLFRRDESFFFRKSYLLQAQAFYATHGGKTIILAQFIPILRTFAPVVAGIGKMSRRRFVLFTA